MREDTVPTLLLKSVRNLFDFSKSLISSSSLQNALITLTPVRFSLVLPSTLSSALCTSLYLGIHQYMTPKITADSIIMVITNRIPISTSMVNAITTAPATIKGERRKSLSVRLTPV